MGHPTTGTSSWADGWGGPCNHRTQLCAIYTPSPPPHLPDCFNPLPPLSPPDLTRPHAIFPALFFLEVTVSSSLFFWAGFFSFLDFLLSVFF